MAKLGLRVAFESQEVRKYVWYKKAVKSLYHNRFDKTWNELDLYYLQECSIIHHCALQGQNALITEITSTVKYTEISLKK